MLRIFGSTGIACILGLVTDSLPVVTKHGFMCALMIPFRSAKLGNLSIKLFFIVWAFFHVKYVTIAGIPLYLVMASSRMESKPDSVFSSIFNPKPPQKSLRIWWVLFMLRVSSNSTFFIARLTEAPHRNLLLVSSILFW